MILICSILIGAEADGALDKARKDKKRQLEDTLNLVIKKRKVSIWSQHCITEYHLFQVIHDLLSLVKLVCFPPLCNIWNLTCNLHLWAGLWRKNEGKRRSSSNVQVKISQM